MKIKSFTLISGNEEGWRWLIHIGIKRNGSFWGKGVISIRDNGEYYRNNQEHLKGKSREYYIDNTKRHIESVRELGRKNPNKKKKLHKKQNAKRRKLGFNELNNSFADSQGHHIDIENVVHIPTKIHQKIRHNIWTGEGMEKINSVAMLYAI